MTHIELDALKKRLFEQNKVKNIKFFPGSDADASPEDFAREINKYFADAEAAGEDDLVLNLETDIEGR